MSSAPFRRSSASWRRECRPAMPAASSRMRRRCWGFAEMISPIWPCRTMAGRARAGGGVGKQKLHILGADFLGIHAIGGALIAIDRRDTSSNSASLKAAGAVRSELSRNSATSAILREGRLPEPEKNHVIHAGGAHGFIEFSPMTQRKASTRLDLPQPFGPTTPVRPGSIWKSVAFAKTLEANEPQPAEFHALRSRTNFQHAKPQLESVFIHTVGGWLPRLRPLPGTPDKRAL